MSEPLTIYGICSGAYSDWQVVALCETREQAEEAVSEMGADYDIEEFDYFPEGTGPGVHRVFLARGIEGSMKVNVGSWLQFCPGPIRPNVHQVPWSRGSHPVYVEATCADRAGAVKAVKDRLAALKAQGDWMPVTPEDAALLGLDREC